MKGLQGELVAKKIHTETIKRHGFITTKFYSNNKVNKQTQNGNCFEKYYNAENKHSIFDDVNYSRAATVTITVDKSLNKQLNSSIKYFGVHILIYYRIHAKIYQTVRLIRQTLKTDQFNGRRNLLFHQTSIIPTLS